MKIVYVRDLFAYLKTLPAVAARVRRHDLGFPFTSAGWSAEWKLLFFHGEPFKPVPHNRRNRNRGAIR